MRSFSASAPDPHLSDRRSDGKGAAVLTSVLAFFEGLLGRARAEEVIVTQYQGRGWDDSTERDLNEEIVRSRLFSF